MIAFIAEHKDHRVADGLRWGVEPLCKVLTEHGVPVSASTYYEWVNARPSARALRDEQVTALIRAERDSGRLVAGFTAPQPRRLSQQLLNRALPPAGLGRAESELGRSGSVVTGVKANQPALYNEPPELDDTGIHSHRSPQCAQRSQIQLVDCGP